MAMFLPGQSLCAICDLPVNQDDDATLFPHVILNELNPKYKLSDSICHTHCVLSNEIGRQMLEVSNNFFDAIKPGRRKCAVCCSEVASPDDHLMIGYLGDPLICCLADFNFTHLHHSHIYEWDHARRFLGLAKRCITTGRWGGGALADIIRQVEAGLLLHPKG